jgi:hypothetical protein
MSAARDASAQLDVLGIRHALVGGIAERRTATAR